jgi:hypothetical protein
MRTAFVAGAAVATILAAGARRAEAVTTTRTSFVGKQVSTFFFASTELDCGGDAGIQEASVFGFIAGASSVTHDEPGPRTISNGVVISIFSFSNPCTGQNVSGDAQIVNGLRGPNPNLKSATLAGSTTLQDFSDPNNPIPVSLDITVTGTSPLSSSGGTTQTRTADGPGGPFTITITRGAFTNRSGTVSGTLTIAGVTFDLTGQPGELISNTTTVVTISKP